MDKIAVFAHYDGDNIIKDYVIYYLKELNKIAQKIIFVSDCDLPQQELKKIENIVYHSIAHRHGEYDFGSYKRGYLYAKENGLLNNCEELIFANDSCYGPLYSLHDVWAECDSDCDFWGINSNSNGVLYHIQSFFIVLKHRIFNTQIFDSFMNNIKKEKSKNDIIEKYEIGLSQLLLNNGFICCSLSDKTIVMDYINMDFIFQKNINPFIKIIVLKNHSKFFAEFMCKCLFKKYKIKYPIDLIFNNLEKKKLFSCLSRDIKSFRKSIIKIHLKDREMFILGKRIGRKNNNDISSEFKGLLPLNF